ncbi:aromatic ring-hydroxylating oxygenase subunit alpha [Rhodobacter ferrooxidans]|uniref:Rieske (2Fe-2S) domain protein n=1 Tax=Rhodobacter ferrooxidans TaxID=371731 RepID=C8RZY1_9RHOB|nr:aromatic ring-hydroxylating dioxygenase subunit alpha [Rhodobacter sp. SW2]EEW25590.1 Rieske (2Fe-2S) domain protein [Rhodobacter sp. SW2]
MPDPTAAAAGLAAETRQIFGRDWLCAGRVESLPDPGCYLTLQVADQPVVVLRDADGQLRAMLNLCLHRKLPLLQGRGKVAAITCPYHAWSYRLDGHLRGASSLLGQGLCQAQTTLHPLRLLVWQGWLLLTLNPGAARPTEALAEVARWIAPCDMTGYAEVLCEDFRWPIDWKALAGSFIQNGAPLPGAAGSQSVLETDVVHLAAAQPAGTPLPGDRRHLTWLLAIYPGLLITLTPKCLWYLCLTPDGADAVRLHFGAALAPGHHDDPDAQALLAQVMTLLQAVQDDARDPGLPDGAFGRYLASRLPA